MKVDFSEIGIGKIGKIGLAPPPQLADRYYSTIPNIPYMSDTPLHRNTDTGRSDGRGTICVTRKAVTSVP